MSYPGEYSETFIEKACQILKIPCKKSYTIPLWYPQDGIFCYREVSGKIFINENDCTTASLVPLVKKKISEMFVSVNHELISDVAQKKGVMDIRLDAVIVEVKNHVINKFKCYEIDGDQHRFPCIGGEDAERRFVETVFSDIIKKDSTHIPYYKGDETIIFDIVKIFAKDFHINPFE